MTTKIQNKAAGFIRQGLANTAGFNFTPGDGQDSNPPDGGGNGNGGSGSTTTSNDIATLKDTVNQITKSDVTTTQNYGADEGAIRNLADVMGARLRAMTDEADDKRLNSLVAIGQNNAAANAQILEANRNADDNWIRQRQKILNVANQLNNSMGNGAYGDQTVKLKRMLDSYDDWSNNEGRNTLRRNINEIKQDLDSKNNGVVTDYNESMSQMYQSSVPDSVQEFLSQINNLEGSTGTNRSVVDEVKKTTTDQRSESNTTSTSGGSSSTNRTNTTQTADINSTETGNNRNDVTVNSNRNRYLNDDGTVNYDKLGQVLGVKFTQNGTIDYERMRPIKLQQRDHYMQSPDRVASLVRRYG